MFLATLVMERDVESKESRVTMPLTLKPLSP